VLTVRQHLAAARPRRNRPPWSVKPPPETFEYRLGNGSALDWVIDQYQVSTDKCSGITNDPTRPTF
jgi:Type ISP C-terminal specificity domain